MSPSQLANYRIGPGVDLIVSWGFPFLLPASLFESAAVGGINVHYSYLPKYRGPIPLHWAIRSGDASAGLSVHWIRDEYDTGPLLDLRRVVELPDDPDFHQIVLKYQEHVPIAVQQAIPDALRGVKGKEQEYVAGPHGWMRPDFLVANQSDTVELIHNQIRTFRFATGGRRGPLAIINGAPIELLRSEMGRPGGFRFPCADGDLFIAESRPASSADLPPRWIRAAGEEA